MTGPDGVAFRAAVPDDWRAIWPIVRSVLAAADTYLLPPDWSEPEARAHWMHTGERRAVTYVAESGGEVVGTAYLKPNHPGPGDHVANAGWMIHPAARGRGIGRAFAEHVLEEARRLGFAAMQFNAVAATNTAAIALWASLGFETVGRVPDAFRLPDGSATAVLVMHRRL